MLLCGTNFVMEKCKRAFICFRARFAPKLKNMTLWGVPFSDVGRKELARVKAVKLQSYR